MQNNFVKHLIRRFLLLIGERLLEFRHLAVAGFHHNIALFAVSSQAWFPIVAKLSDFEYDQLSK